jgi:anti-sigma regulatory factor (Ser/Thr protein kinase)
MGGDAAYRVSVPAEPAGLDHLHDLIDRARRDWPEVASNDFDLLEMAIIELAGNVARHGRPAGATDVTLTLFVDDDALRATLVDAGRHFAVDLDAEMPDELDEAGRGIVIARRAVDRLQYEHAGGVNTWRLQRHRRQPG